MARRDAREAAGGPVRSREEGPVAAPRSPSVARPDRLDRRALAWGVVASAAVHALAVLAAGVVASGPGPVRSDGPSARSSEAAPLADALVGVRVAVRRDEIRAPPRPRLAIADPLVDTRPPTSASALPSGSVAVGRPPATPGGRVAGEGGGRGAAGAGSPDSAVPAVPRSVFPEWNPPASVRGMEVTVRVRVDAEGRPTGEVELLPATPDRAFNRRLVEKVRRMEYRPAREGGTAVPGWAEITFVF